jgi:PTS system nitrogen regulatory IIA component
MSQDDFDVESLARYLHISPQQVERLAERGNVPARKVAGKWRFSPPEIHHWLEKRIGLADQQELEQVEVLLERSGRGAHEKPISLATLIPPGGIAVPLIARTRRSVITSMCELAARSGVLWDPQAMADAVRRREAMQSTALDIGIALLHPRRPLPRILSHAAVLLGRTNQGIPFGGSRSLTDIFFLICSTDDRGHLRILARLGRLLSHTALLEAIRAARDAASVRQLIVDCENRLDA